MKIRLINIGFILALFSMFFAACEEVEPVIEEIEFDRIFAPVNLDARIRNMTAVELSWDIREGVDSYMVEISEDSLEFNSIIRTAEVAPGELPYTTVLDGETQYSARVKGVSDGVADSKWSTVVFETDPEDILPDVLPEDLEATFVTLRWPAGSEVTHFIINPGNVNRTITAEEKEAGAATITGLTGSTEYTVTLFRDSKRRGQVVFTTLVDVGTATRVYPEDDLLQVIASASDGDVLALFPGEYGTLENRLTIAIDKSISIRGVYPHDMPVIYGQLTCGATVTSIEVRNIIFRGADAGQFFNTVTGCNLGSLSIIDCDISGYTNNFIYNNASGTYGSILVKGSYVHNIPGGGGDGIDFRGGAISSLTVENSTFANGFRTFLRMQVECATSFKNCTFYRISNVDNSNNNGLFRSSGGGTFEVRNCLFVETGVQNPTAPQAGNFTRQASYMVDAPEYANNNIYNCYNIFVGLYTSASQVSATELDPGFADPANGDFTVTNQTLIDENIGDPRWLGN